MTAGGVTAVSPAMVRAVIDHVRQRRYTSRDGAIGIRGRLSDDRLPGFDHGGEPVDVRSCPSALAARAALLERRPGRWLVLVTDRDEEDLGVGVLTHLVGQQLRSPDPWQAVRQRFGATSVDLRLAAGSGHREVAHGLLETMPASGWPPAPGGVLTQDHAYGAVARTLLDLPDGPVDLVTVLGWTTRVGVAERLAALRASGGDALADAVLAWLASLAGSAAPIVARLLSQGRAADLVPLGLVTGFLATHPERESAALATARLEYRWNGVGPGPVVALSVPVSAVVQTLLADNRTRAEAERAIARADALLVEARAEGLAGSSDVLRTGLQQRLHRLADLLRGDPVRALPEVEKAWAAVSRHALADSADRRLVAFAAAVRLVRWLAGAAAEEDPAIGLAAAARRQADQDAWVDAAVNDAAEGVDDPGLGAGLAAVLERVRVVRDRHDVEFARALARATADETGVAGGHLDADGGRTYLLERVLPEVVLPLAHREPTLLLVLDGLSTGVATEVLGDVLDRSGSGWAEELAPGTDRRLAALAVLPSITEVSRASLLCGELVRGGQDVEQRGYAALTKASGLEGAPLFHKRLLDTTRLGFSLSDPVRAAIDDTEGQPLVTCVLNTIDDALDRSDPAGTTWTAETVKHLRPLLERARTVGRRVVITADHGHIVERRQGEQRIFGSAGPARYRAAVEPVGPDEVLVSGQRLLEPGHEAVLAVSERLRYGPLKAGYHGGAASAEVVVPVVILVPIERTDGVRLAPPHQPEWWSPGSAEVLVTAPVAAGPVTLPTLFDEEPPAPVDRLSIGRAIVASAVYDEQKPLAGRVTLDDGQVARVLDRLAGAPHQRLSPTEVASALEVAVPRVAGAVQQLRKLLNIEGYPVLTVDSAVGAVVLDLDLAREQFEIRG